MYKYNYHGPFKIHIQNFLEVKQALGYKYLTEASHLKRFDKFTCERYNSISILTKEIVMEWCSKKPYERQTNLRARTSVMRQFAIYLDNHGIDTYVVPKRHFSSGEKYVSYIYTETELQRFFSETDKCHYCSQCPYRHLIMPILFRIIYSCGLRVSEARLLKVREVDLHNGILTINQSKNNKNRLVPMTNEITRRCKVYSMKVHRSSNVEECFFPKINGEPLTSGNIYKNFRKFLWKAGISHGGRGFGPRIHDLGIRLLFIV